MTFCGHCGLQLSPGSTRCPRCGASVEPAEIATGSDLHMDDATIASRAFIPPNQGPAQTPINQQPLVLRGNSQGTQDANGAISRVEQANYNTPPMQQVRGNSYSGFPPPQGTGNLPFQSNSGYPSPQGTGNLPFQSNGGYPVQNTGGYQPQAPYPSYPGAPYTNVPPQMDAGYQQYQNPYPPQQQQTNTKGRTTGLIIVFIGLLLILSAALLFAMQQGLIGSNKATGGNSGGATPAIIAAQLTQSTILHNDASHFSALPHFEIDYNRNTQSRFIFYGRISQQSTIINFTAPISTIAPIRQNISVL